MIHCAPVAESDSSFWRSGIAIATIVWSMNVIATANTIAARTRFLLATPFTRPVSHHVRPTGTRLISARAGWERQTAGSVRVRILLLLLVVTASLGAAAGSASAVATPSFADGDGLHVTAVKQLGERLFA